MRNKLIALLLGFTQMVWAQLPGLIESPYFNEQTITFRYEPEIRVQINAPSIASFDTTRSTGLVLYALPNGNTIEQTVGKTMEAGDDWHFDIQHIGAQTRFLRDHISDYNVVTIYLETDQLSWPAWKAAHSDHATIIQDLTGYLMGIFQSYDPFLMLTGHSGGGRFTFSFLDGVDAIPTTVKRISFLDSNYGYEHSYGDQMIQWLNASGDHFLSVIAYNDSVALYNGEPIVSPTGGTWYRSRIMKQYMSNHFTFTDSVDDDFIRYTALDGRIKFILKQNPEQAILHTLQVERNGHIQGMVSGTPDEAVDYVYYGARAYSEWIQTNIPHLAHLMIPPRPANARSGSQFMNDVSASSFSAREQQMWIELRKGNIPGFMRQLETVTTTFTDHAGMSHSVSYQVMPDYLAIGSDADFCRVPMGPILAQRAADLFGAVLPTRKLVNSVYTHCDIQLAPVTYAPVGNQNELVPKFVEHNAAINSQFASAGGVLGQLTGGTKKDVVLSNLIVDPSRPDHVCIYGWHQLNGNPIQPLTNIHINTYVDYSHGIRFLNDQIWLDGEITGITDVLSDPASYSILSDESGVMTQPTYLLDTNLPSKPRTFGVRRTGSQTVEVLVSNDGNATSWRVWAGNSPTTLVEMGDFATSPIELIGLVDNETYFVQLQAMNNVGVSEMSEMLATVSGPQDEHRILIINGFDRGTSGNSYDFVRQHGTAIQAAGFVYDSATNDALTAGLLDVNDYETVDLILGDESTADETFSNDEQTLFKAFLRQGGNLFVSGSEIAWDLDYRGSASDKTFINNYLKVRYLMDAPGNSSGTYYGLSAIGGSIFDGLSAFNFDDGSQGTIDVDWPDVYEALDGGTANMLYTGFNATNGIAGVNYHGVFPSGSQAGSVVVMGVPFESMYPESARLTVMDAVLNYFQTVTSSDPKPLQPRDYTLSQNYPNPFNPITRIEFALPQPDHVRLSVFDLRGSEREVLASKDYSAGWHQVAFNAQAYPSGVYIYRLQTPGTTLQRKMTVLK